jgi:nitrite reductase/ring-hydroxylating ferredoxin subunit
MNLTDLLTSLPIQPQPGQRWAIAGPEAAALPQKFGLTIEPAAALPQQAAQLDGLILAGVLSAQTDAAVWLHQVAATLPAEAGLFILDWQADGPLDAGPSLECRFKRGKLLRLLRDYGFGRIQLVSSQPRYYAVWAVKTAASSVAYAGEFVAVATLAELPKNSMKVVEVFGHTLIMANTGQEIVAFARACPHAGTALDGGRLRGRQVFCPTHFYMWNVCTGQPIQPDDEDSLPVYPVKVDEQGQVWVAL